MSFVPVGSPRHCRRSVFVISIGRSIWSTASQSCWEICNERWRKMNGPGTCAACLPSRSSKHLAGGRDSLSVMSPCLFSDSCFARIKVKPDDTNQRPKFVSRHQLYLLKSMIDLLPYTNMCPIASSGCRCFLWVIDEWYLTQPVTGHERICNSRHLNHKLITKNWRS